VTILSRYRPRCVHLRDGRRATNRAIVAAGAAAIVRAFERLSAALRYSRFMWHKKHLDPVALERGVRPFPGCDFALVVTIPAHSSAFSLKALFARCVPKVCWRAIALAE